MSQSHIQPFPETPWKREPRGFIASNWRGRSKSSIRHIVEAISPQYNGLCADNINPRSAAGSMTDAIFHDLPQVVDDRLDLIKWLGGAGGFVAENMARPWQVRGSLGLVDRILMEQWAASAWRQAPDMALAMETNFPLEKIIKVDEVPDGPNLEWGRIPTGWIPGTLHEQTNAQMDLINFLQAFEQQTGRQLVPFEKPSPHTSQSRIVHCCVALRILSSTTDLIDSLLLTYLNFFESLYDHQHVPMDLLQLAGAAADLKILTGVVEDAGNEATESSNAPWRRKL